MSQTDDPHMHERAAEKAAAMADSLVSLDVLDQQHRDPDHWERICLVRAFSATNSGCYGLASVEAWLAMTPPDQRSPSAVLPNDPTFKRVDLPFLMPALPAIELEPPQAFPHFGPARLGD